MISVSNPALATLLGMGPPNLSGVTVDQETVLGISAVYRAVALITGSIAGLPMRTLRTAGGQTTRVPSFLDDPGGPEGPTPYGWAESIMLHLLLHGNAYLIHVYNGAGALVALIPASPMVVSTELAATWPDDRTRRVVGGKLFTVSMNNGAQVRHDATTLTHIVGMSLDGYFGVSPITVAKNSLGTSIAGDRAAANMFSDGALYSGLVTPEDDVDEFDAVEVAENIRRGAAGWEHASELVVVNRRLKFTPWKMSSVDAQFLESRTFQVEEIARWFGIPPHLLMQTDKQTSWGTGVAEQNRGLQRTVLAPWATRIEQTLSRLLPGDRYVEFDFTGLVRPTPEQEIDLLMRQVDQGLISLNEAREIRNLPPVPGGDVIRVHGIPLDQIGGAM